LNVLVAQVVLFLRPHLPTDRAISALAVLARGDLQLLRDLDPSDQETLEVLKYLAIEVYCPGAVRNLDLSELGHGLVLGDQSVRVIDSAGRTVRLISPMQIVKIVCTTRASHIEGPLGASDLWNYLGDGWVPDSYLYTGTNDPVAPPCRSAT
jgi:hypothetical protein